MPKNVPDELVVKYGALDGATTDLGNEARRVEECLSALQRAVQKVGEGWEGEAHAAYLQLQAKWDSRATTIHNALKQIGQQVSLAGGDYMAGDKKAASYFQ
ncbi:WXG100 family type VII secretion target [Streptomyces sp. N35]|uniref:WXG100 family type VII secretion target n=1 Tax=Streptomyces sp. N35 TaxID=2795730 RepID=UPI0018F5F449|nr:WXG100 family type VII secretion target [Streptomyces sp. N35]